MNLETLERLIDEAIDKEDYKKLLELLDEREKLLKSMEVSPELAEKLLRRDEERMRKIEGNKAKLIETIMKSREYGKSIQAYGKSISEQGKRNWGRG